MTKNCLIGVIVLTALTACSRDQASDSPRGIELTEIAPVTSTADPAEATPELIESVVRKYFDHFSNYDYESMRSMATPEFETIDGGIRLTHPEFEDYVRNTAELHGVELDFKLSQLRTRIAGDVAYTTFLLTYGDLANTDLVTLRLSDEQWLIDVFDHQRASDQPEAVVRQFYHDIKAYNFEGMRSMITPGFNVLYAGTSLDWDGFQLRHSAEEEELGSAESRSQRYLYKLWDFNVVEETPDTILVSFRANNPETRVNEAGEEVPVFNTSYLNSWILRRVGPNLKVHFLGSMPASDG